MKARLLFLLALVLPALACARFNITVGNPFNGVVGSGKLAEEERPLGELDGVSLENSGDLEIRLGSENIIHLQADDNVLPLLETVVEDGLLHIRTKPGQNFTTRTPIRYTLTVKEGALARIDVTSSGDIQAPDLETAGGFRAAVNSSGSIVMGDLAAQSFDLALNSSGDFQMGALSTGNLDVQIGGSGNAGINGGVVQGLAADLSSSGSFAAEQLEVRSEGPVSVECRGSGSFRLGLVEAESVDLVQTSSGDGSLISLQAGSLDVTINSSGRLKIDGGEVDEQKLELTSSGSYTAPGLASREVEAELTGSGGAVVQAAESLKARLSGSGSLEYTGSPQVDAEATGSGDVVQR